MQQQQQQQQAGRQGGASKYPYCGRKGQTSYAGGFLCTIRYILAENSEENSASAGEKCAARDM